MLGLVVSFYIFTFFFFIWILQVVLNRQGRINKRLESYVSSDLNHEKIVETHQHLLSKVMGELNHKLKRAFTPSKQNQKIELFLQSTGVSWAPSEYIIFRWLAGCIGGGLIFLLTSNVILSMVIFVLGHFYPKLWLNSKRKQRLKKFNDGLADMITAIINSLRAGFSFIQALKAVEEEVDTPIKEEIALVLKELQYGSSLEDAFTHFYQRLPSEDLDIMIQAILIQRQVGGNLATVLSNIVDTIRERNKIHRQVKTLTAQGKMSGMVIGAMPFVIGLIIFLIQPSYVLLMFENVVGIIMLSFGFISGIIGFILIRKLSKIEV